MAWKNLGDAGFPDRILWHEVVAVHHDSNVVHAHRLLGKLLLTVGEMDTNVDPASTYRVADALIRAGKEFDFFAVPGGGHARGPEHVRKRWDFLVRHVMDVTPPDWNRVRLEETAEARPRP